MSFFDGALYFTEVKYRRLDSRGDGLEAIDHKKQKQMRYAAEIFLSQHKLNELNAILCAASLSGDDYHMTALLQLD